MIQNDVIVRLRALLEHSKVPYENTLFIRANYSLADHRREIEQLIRDMKPRSSHPTDLTV